mgnify:CR=1 FL=1
MLELVPMEVTALATLGAFWGLGILDIEEIISGFGNIIILNIDILMVSALLGLSNTGIYTTAFYIGIIIEMPRRAISQISLPIISNHFSIKLDKAISIALNVDC